VYSYIGVCCNRLDCSPDWRRLSHVTYVDSTAPGTDGIDVDDDDDDGVVDVLPGWAMTCLTSALLVPTLAGSIAPSTDACHCVRDTAADHLSVAAAAATNMPPFLSRAPGPGADPREKRGGRSPPPRRLLAKKIETPGRSKVCFISPRMHLNSPI